MKRLVTPAEQAHARKANIRAGNHASAIERGVASMKGLAKQAFSAIAPKSVSLMKAIFNGRAPQKRETETIRPRVIKANSAEAQANRRRVEGLKR